MSKHILVVALSFPLFFVFQGSGLMPPNCAHAES